MSVEYLDLADFLLIAEAVTGLDVKTLTKVSRLPLADSALHAPSAGFGDDDMYPDFVDKAAVLLVRLAMNHPLPDGNKRAAWVSMRMFVAINGWSWAATPPIPATVAMPHAGPERSQPNVPNTAAQITKSPRSLIRF